MANIIGPFGFRYLGLVDGSPPNFGLASGVMAYNAAAIFQGDPIILVGGKIQIATVTGNAGAAVVGIANSFEWVSIALGYKVRRPTYPGNDSVGNADVTVFFANNPGALFEVQVASAAAGTVVGGPAVQADVGAFFNFSTGAGGNTRSGVSSFGIDYSTKNAAQGTLPFYLYQLEAAPRTDPATAGNLVRVGFATLTKAG